MFRLFRRQGVMLVVILLISAGLRFVNVDFSDGKPVFDERGHYLRAVRTYLAGEDDTVPEHPPLGKELIALGILLFGDNPVGWRMPSLVFSLVGIVLVYLLAREMFCCHSGASEAINTNVMLERRHVRRGVAIASQEILSAAKGGLQVVEDSDSRRDDHKKRHSSFIPLVSALLLSVDSMYFIYSRLAVLDMFLTVFVLLTMLFLWRTYRDGGVLNLVLLATSFGLAFATKWTTLHLAPVVAVFLWLRYRWGKKLLGVVGMMGVVGAGVYVITYVPYLTRHSFEELVDLERRTVTVWKNFDRDRVFTLETYVMRHAHSWIFNPVSAYFSEPAGGKLRLVIGLYNPVVLWGGVGWLVWWTWKRKKKHVTLERSDRVSDVSLKSGDSIASPRQDVASLQNDTLPFLFLLFPILMNFLPWFFVRRVQYPYYFLPSLPLLVILVSSVLERARRVKRDWVAIFLLSAIIMFGYLFPFLTSVPANPALLNPLASGPIRIRLFYDETPERVIFSP